MKKKTEFIIQEKVNGFWLDRKSSLRPFANFLQASGVLNGLLLEHQDADFRIVSRITMEEVVVTHERDKNPE